MKYFCILACLLGIQSIFAADTTRILWFGHSLLASGSNGRSVEFDVWSRHIGIPIKQALHNSGCNYSYEIMQSWKETCNPDTIREAVWDYVIYNTLYKVYLPDDSFFKYQGLYVNLIDSVGAKAVLYDDWHQPSTPFAMEVCKTKGAFLSPVQSAFLWVSEHYPDIHYKVDWAHAAEPLGYLAGAVTWSTVFCRNTFGYDSVYPGLDHETAHLMQQVAWNTVVDTPYIGYQPWSHPPALVKRIAFSPEPDTLEQFRSKQLLISTVFTNDSVDTSSQWAIFRSLDPGIVAVTHSGEATGILLGTGRVEAVREKARDTLYLTVKGTSLALDSVRIVPHSFASYLENSYQFHALGYFRDGSDRTTQDVTTSIRWLSGDSTIFTLAGGRIQRTSGKGGNVFAAVEMSGKTDTVRFNMARELQYLKRINFQPDSTVLNPVWTPDWGLVYTDSMGYGWEDMRFHNGKPYFAMEWDYDAIMYYEANFLLRSFLSPRNPLNNHDTLATYHLKCLDGDYIIKVGLGHGNWNSIDSQINMVLFGNDTLALDTSFLKKPAQTYKDTIRVFGMDGIKLKMKGAINYLVVCTKEGVDIDSIALDNGEFAVKTELSPEELSRQPDIEPSALIVSPNPFNPETRISLRGAKARGALRIFSSRGRLVAQLSPQNGFFFWNAKGLPSGLYAARYMADGKQLQSTIVLLK